MNRRAVLARSLLIFAALAETGCGTRGQQPAPENLGHKVWTGRLGLQVASEPPQSFSASFELKGTALTGELTLVSPLGSTLATLRWSPGSATLRTAQEVQQYESVDTLTRRMVGTPLPIHALFDWLNGINTTAAGWRADLGRLEQGRLAANRTTPEPAAELRLLLDQ